MKISAVSTAAAVDLRHFARLFRYCSAMSSSVRVTSLICRHGGPVIGIPALITEAAPVQRILAHISEPTAPRPIAPARGPPAWDDDPEPMPDWDLVAQPDPGFAFDQRIYW